MATSDDMRNMLESAGDATLRAEAALRESDEQQRLTVQLVPALLWWTDAAGKDLAVNHQWKNYTGVFCTIAVAVPVTSP